MVPSKGGLTPAEPPIIFLTRASRYCLRLQGKGGVIQSLSVTKQAGPGVFLTPGLLIWAPADAGASLGRAYARHERAPILITDAMPTDP